MGKHITVIEDIEAGALEIADGLDDFLCRIDDLVSLAQNVLDELVDDEDEDGKEFEAFEGIQSSLTQAYSHLDQAISDLYFQ